DRGRGPARHYLSRARHCHRRQCRLQRKGHGPSEVGRRRRLPRCRHCHAGIADPQLRPAGARETRRSDLRRSVRRTASPLPGICRHHGKLCRAVPRGGMRQDHGPVGESRSHRSCHDRIDPGNQPMRIFANPFLIMFLADGGFSLIDELVPLLSPLASFTQLRSLLAGTVIVMAAALYPCLGIDRRLPKRVFLPQILFALICPFSTWLFPPLAGIRTYGLMAAAVQVALGMLPLHYFRKGGARCLTMPPEMFAAPFFRLKNTLIFGATSLFFAPFALILLILFTVNAYMTEYTSGFMRLDPGGLRMAERVYKRDNRTIRLAAMIHVGNKEFYDELAGSIAPGRIIVLVEGVSDDENLLAGSIDYGKMAGYLGLTSQKEMHFRGRVIEPEELESPRLRSRKAGDGKPAGEVDILRADVDASDLRPPTILL